MNDILKKVFEDEVLPSYSEFKERVVAQEIVKWLEDCKYSMVVREYEEGEPFYKFYTPEKEIIFIEKANLDDAIEEFYRQRWKPDKG